MLYQTSRLIDTISQMWPTTMAPLNFQPQPQSPLNLCVHYIYNYSSLLISTTISSSSGHSQHSHSFISLSVWHLTWSKPFIVKWSEVSNSPKWCDSGVDQWIRQTVAHPANWQNRNGNGMIKKTVSTLDCGSIENPQRSATTWCSYQRLTPHKFLS